jgi:uncharacterized RDD family membrane protein YckC
MTDRGIVTPEAVVLAFDTAGLGSRILAEIIDLAVEVAVVVVVIFGAGVLGNTVVGGAGVYYGLFAVPFGYPLAFETLWRGRTLGKAAMGLRVVTVEGGPIRFRHALVRTVFTLVDFWGTAGAVAVLTVLFTRRNQRLGDLVAGTLVLRERTGAPVPSAAWFAVPGGWESYAATLDVSGLTATDYQAARSFLMRAGTLDVRTRDTVARQIASALLPRLRHVPPPGVPAEVFLLCVAARYQQRQRGAVVAPGPATTGPPPQPVPAPGTTGTSTGGYTPPS